MLDRRLKDVIRHQAELIQQHELHLVFATQQARDEVINVALKAHASMAAAAVEQARQEGVARGIQIGQAGLEAALEKAREEGRACGADAANVNLENVRKKAVEEGKAEDTAQQAQLRQELHESRNDLTTSWQQAAVHLDRCSKLKKELEERLKEEASLKKSKAVLQDRVDRLHNQKQELQQEVCNLTQKLALLGDLQAERKPDVRVVKCPSNYPKPYHRGQEDPRYRPCNDCTQSQG